jgi:hypothetical protein
MMLLNRMLVNNGDLPRPDQDVLSEVVFEYANKSANSSKTQLSIKVENSISNATQSQTGSNGMIDHQNQTKIPVPIVPSSALYTGNSIHMNGHQSSGSTSYMNSTTSDRNPDHHLSGHKKQRDSDEEGHHQSVTTDGEQHHNSQRTSSLTFEANSSDPQQQHAGHSYHVSKKSKADSTS